MCMRGRDRDTSPYDLPFECVNILATHDIGYEPNIAYYNKESQRYVARAGWCRSTMEKVAFRTAET